MELWNNHHPHPNSPVPRSRGPKGWGTASWRTRKGHHPLPSQVGEGGERERLVRFWCGLLALPLRALALAALREGALRALLLLPPVGCQAATLLAPTKCLGRVRA